MFQSGDQGEPSSNKTTDIVTNKASNTFFPTVKAVFDWVSGLFVKGAASSTDNAIARFNGTTGKIVKNSGVTIDDAGTLTVPKMITPNSGTFFQPYSLSAYYPVFNANGADVQLLVQRGTNKAVGFGASTTGSLKFMSFSDTLPLTASLMMEISPSGLLTLPSIKAGQIIDSAGNSGINGQVLKKVGGLVLWSNP